MKRWMGLMFVMFALVVAGCGSSGDGDNGSASEGATGTTAAAHAPSPRGQDGAATTAPSAPAPAGGQQDQSALLAQAAGRQVIYTAKLQVEVTDVFAAAADAKRMASAAGGYLFTERSVETEASLQPQSEITFKLPPQRFGGVMDDLARLGRERGRQVDASDVTAQLIDLDARLRTAETSLTRVRALLAEAKSVQEVVNLEGEVTKRETLVEQLKGQVNQISRQVEFATVTVIFGQKLVFPTTVEEGNDLPGPLDGLVASARVFWTSLRIVVLVLAVLVPFVPLALLAAWGTRVVSRRVRRRHEPPTAPPTPERRDEMMTVS
jgi:hypothetical protein